MKKILTLLAVAVMAVSMTQCANNTPAAEQAKIEAGTAWKLISMTAENNAVEIPEGSEVTINFLDSLQLVGNAGCNIYFGSYKTDEDNVLALNPMGMTKMACPNMDFEDKFIANLFNVRSYSIKDSTLTLLDSLNTEIMVLTPSSEMLIEQDEEK